jgi:lysozyme
MRRACKDTVDLISHFEGLHKKDGDDTIPYRDVAGFWTIGYGHLICTDRSLPQPNMRWNSLKSSLVLHKDMMNAEQGVVKLINVPLTDGQFGALVSFAFNLGLGSLQASTLRKRVNAEEHDDVPYQLSRWCMAGGRKMKGLVRRRAAEGQLYESDV